MTGFADRREAGRVLADVLSGYKGQSVVYALPRGGVELGVEVSLALDAPLELITARKVGHPANPEYAVCAVTETGPLVCNEAERVRLDPTWLAGAEAAERSEAVRRRQVYGLGLRSFSVAGKVAIVVDDGIATGLTMRAAVSELQYQQPGKLIVAVPCAPHAAIDDLYELADEMIVLTDPSEYLGAVGAYYAAFPQLTDEDVVDLLGASSWRRLLQ